MKQKLITLLVLTVVAVVLALPNSEPTAAQESIATPNAECPVQRLNNIVNVKSDFYVALEEQLESADLTSERLFDLYQDFNQARTRINNIADNAVAVSQDGSPTENSAISQTCLLFAETQQIEMEQVFNEYLNQVTVRTRNFLLLEQFDSMNDDLRDLQETFQDIRMNVTEFHDQLPCFVTECIQR